MSEEAKVEEPELPRHLREAGADQKAKEWRKHHDTLDTLFKNWQYWRRVNNLPLTGGKDEDRTAIEKDWLAYCNTHYDDVARQYNGHQRSSWKNWIRPRARTPVGDTSSASDQAFTRKLEKLASEKPDNLKEPDELRSADEIDSALVVCLGHGLLVRRKLQYRMYVGKKADFSGVTPPDSHYHNADWDKLADDADVKFRVRCHGVVGKSPLRIAAEQGHWLVVAKHLLRVESVTLATARECLALTVAALRSASSAASAPSHPSVTTFKKLVELFNESPLSLAVIVPGKDKTKSVYSFPCRSIVGLGSALVRLRAYGSKLMAHGASAETLPTGSKKNKFIEFFCRSIEEPLSELAEMTHCHYRNHERLNRGDLKIKLGQLLTVYRDFHKNEGMTTLSTHRSYVGAELQRLFPKSLFWRTESASQVQRIERHIRSVCKAYGFKTDKAIEALIGAYQSDQAVASASSHS